MLLLDASYETLYNHFGAELHMGFNVHAPFLIWFQEANGASGLKDAPKSYLPGKFGVNYYLKSPWKAQPWNVYWGLFVKSNVGQADFLETAIGIDF